jgi:hypothetical protein
LLDSLAGLEESRPFWLDEEQFAIPLSKAVKRVQHR